MKLLAVVVAVLMGVGTAWAGDFSVDESTSLTPGNYLFLSDHRIKGHEWRASVPLDLSRVDISPKDFKPTQDDLKFVIMQMASALKRDQEGLELIQKALNKKLGLPEGYKP